MKIVKEFSRFARHYDNHNIIQAQVAEKLILMLEDKHYNRVVDIGCGSGAVYKNMLQNNIVFDSFTALDFSEEMLSLHPTDENVIKKHFDFNCADDFKELQKNYYNVVLSSSALQWSDDLAWTLKQISSLGEMYYFAFFTSKTFSSLHQVAGVQSPIYSKEMVQKTLNLYYKSTFETVTYHLTFGTVREMFRYIKQSGVSGGQNQLSYKQMKALMQNYPLNYLEFEVLFVKGKIK
ncbi:MAG: methyltransferase [Sulfurovum sp. FS06-10]|jgi:malonyl-CoA O-methyltransferase|nr:MAG: methyltransferase [Sulfurovum sp. FS06-10]